MIIQMTQTRRLANYGKSHTFFKGRKYKAVLATNQPEFLKKGLVFVQKFTGESLLIERGEYQIIDGSKLVSFR